MEYKFNTHLMEGEEIEVQEHFKVFRNIQLNGSEEFIPGRSVYGMGTSYKRPKKGEQRIVHLTYNADTKEFWIIPEELVKP